jgi:SAM-dependent methyltransferase
MKQLINLLENYPQTKRDIKERGEDKTEEDRAIARQFGEEFFDGERRHGYGGFNYFPRFWQPVIPTFQQHYGLTTDSRILDVGCAKGFMLYDFTEIIPGIEVHGVDVSAYAIENAKEEIRDRVQVAGATALPFDDNAFDLVISINTVHNLEGEDLERSFQEIERVSNGNSFITVDAYNTDEEKEAMDAWNLTAKTIMSADNWITYFDRVGYTGDYYWFMP